MNYLNALPQSLVPVLNLADRVATCTTAAADRVATCTTAAADRVATCTTAAADRAIAVWSFLTQPQAMHTYRWLGAMTVALGQLIFWSALWTYAQVQQWVNEEVALALPCPELEAHYFATVEELFAQADEVASRSMPQAMTAPIAIIRLAPSTSHEDGLDREYELADMTLTQLKPIAEKLNLPTRKVRKADLIDNILHAEGYEI